MFSGVSDKIPYQEMLGKVKGHEINRNERKWFKGQLRPRNQGIWIIGKYFYISELHDKLRCTGFHLANNALFYLYLGLRLWYKWWCHQDGRQHKSCRAYYKRSIYWSTAMVITGSMIVKEDKISSNWMCDLLNTGRQNHSIVIVWTFFILSRFSWDRVVSVVRVNIHERPKRPYI